MYSLRRPSFLALCAAALLGATASLTHIAMAVAASIVMAARIFIGWIAETNPRRSSVEHPMEKIDLALLQARQYATRLLKRLDLWPNSYGCSPR